jgi:hypothetical protein
MQMHLNESNDFCQCFFGEWGELVLYLRRCSVRTNTFYKAHRHSMVHAAGDVNSATG